MLVRNLLPLIDSKFDVCVIGGGISGLGIAWEAALRGLRVCLLERTDFGAKTSQGCFGIVHGGLRYLQHLNFKRLRVSVREQQILRQIAAAHLRPLPCLVPTYGYGSSSKEFLRSGLCLYSLLSRTRNQGVSEKLHLGPAQVLGTEEALAMAPGLNPLGLRGAVVFYDAEMKCPERLTLAVAKSAVKAGALLNNYLELVQAEFSNSCWQIKAKDALSGAEFRLYSRALINAAGPELEDVLLRVGERVPSRQFVRGTQVVLGDLGLKMAVAVSSKQIDPQSLAKTRGRSFFFLPKSGKTLVGTYERLCEKNSPEDRESDVLAFLRELQAAYPRVPSETFSEKNLISSFGGLIPLTGQAEAQSYRVAKELNIATHSAKALLSVYAVKYTTFRYVAEQTINRLESVLAESFRKSVSAETFLVGGEDLDPSMVAGRAAELGLSSSLAQRLLEQYGSEIWELFAVLKREPELAEDLLNDESLLKLEVSYAVRYEMAQTVDDVLRRRTAVVKMRSISNAELEKINKYFQSCGE